MPNNGASYATTRANQANKLLKNKWSITDNFGSVQ